MASQVQIWVWTLVNPTYPHTVYQSKNNFKLFFETLDKCNMTAQALETLATSRLHLKNIHNENKIFFPYSLTSLCLLRLLEKKLLHNCFKMYSSYHVHSSSNASQWLSLPQQILCKSTIEYVASVIFS